MIERIIDWCAANRFLVFTGTVILTVWGIWAMTRTPLDAVPDISDVQVIVSTEWMGRSPDLIEDQITYPIVSALISTPKVKAVRGFTDFGISYVYVIFQDGTDMYWARSRVVEYLQGIRGQLPGRHEPGHRARRHRRRLGVRIRLGGRDRPAQSGGSARLPGLAPPLLAGVGARRRGSRQHRRVRQAVPGQHRSEQAGGLRDRHQGRHPGHQDEQQRRRGSVVGVLRPRVHGPRAGVPHVAGRHRRRVSRRESRRHAGPRA